MAVRLCICVCMMGGGMGGKWRYHPKIKPVKDSSPHSATVRQLIWHYKLANNCGQGPSLPIFFWNSLAAIYCNLSTHLHTHTHTHFTHSESITNCCWPREWNNGQGSIMNMPSVGEGGQEVGVEWPCRFILFTRCMQCISTHLPTMHIKVISLYHHRLSVAQFAATFPDVPFWP